MKKTTLKDKALDFYLNYYKINNLEDPNHQHYFKEFFRDYKKVRNLLMKKKPCLWLICKRYTRGRTNNTSERKAIITDYKLQYIINMISGSGNWGYFKTGGIGTSHALNIYDKIVYKLGFSGCCDPLISQGNYIES